MSNAAAAEAPLPRSLGKKKLIVIVAVVLLALAAAGAGALLLLKKNSADEADEGDGEETAQVEPAKGKQGKDPKAIPTFVPLDAFTVNLADRETERYAQISVTLEVKDDQAAERVKAFLPAVRNNILMVLAHKTSEQLLQREGKTELAEEIRRETMRALGIDADADAGSTAKGSKKRKARKVAEPVEQPVTGVHFSNFIVQ